MALTRAKVFADGKYVDNLFNVQWQVPHLNFNDIPSFSFLTDNFHGRNYNTYGIGKDVKIYRNGELQFTGVIEPKNYTKGDNGQMVSVQGKHKGYVAMQRAFCEGYRTSDGFVNPWQWGRKDVSGREVDGINAADMMRNLFGTLFTHQNFFSNRTPLMTFDGLGASGFQYVSIFDPIGNSITYLTARRSDSGNTVGYVLGSGSVYGQAHSTHLHNGPIQTVSGVKVRGMGDINSVKVTLIGDANFTLYPRISVCRDGNSNINNRTYFDVPLTSSSVTGVTLLWTGQYTFSGNETVKNQLGYVIYPNGYVTGYSTLSNAMHYLRIDAVTTSDIGLTEGTIAPYTGQFSTFSTGLVMNLIGMNRLDAAEKVRKLCVTADSVKDQPAWDAWIDNNLKANFGARRGVTLSSTEYSFAKFNVKSMEHKLDASNMINNIIAKGAGAPPAQRTIISDQLVDLDSIAAYGSRQGVFSDSSINDDYTLLLRAKSYLKLYKSPIETLSVKIINDWTKPWNVGDMIHVRDSDLGVDSYWRINSAKYSIKGDGIEDMDIELGNKGYKGSDLIKGISSNLNQQDVYYRGTTSSSVTSSISIPFDTLRPAVYNFVIPEDVDISGVYIYAKTEPFKATSKGAVAASLSNNAIIAASGGASIQNAQLFNPPAFNTWATVGTPTNMGNIDTMASLVSVSCSTNDTSSTTVNARVTDGTNTITSETQNINTTGKASFALLWPFNTNGKTLTVQFIQSNPTTNGLTYYVSYSITYMTAPSHNHGNAGHTHPIQFGIYQFSGDAGLFTVQVPSGSSGAIVPSGAPMYPTNIQMFVDKLPSSPTAVAHDGWGIQGLASGSINVTKLDITAALKDAGGVIQPGPHFVSFLPFTGQNINNSSHIDDSNVQGLGQIAVNHFVKLNQKGSGGSTT